EVHAGALFLLSDATAPPEIHTLSLHDALPISNSIVVNQDFPIAGEAGGGPWLTNGPGSIWIGPQPDQTCCGLGTAGGNGGNLPGDGRGHVRTPVTWPDRRPASGWGRRAVDREG